MNPSFLAFDLGATSGRAILGTLDDGKLSLKTICQFPNTILPIHGKYYWNIFHLYESILEGFRRCASEGIQLTSAGIDTWGVDFALLGEDGSMLGLPRAYRDPYTRGMQENLFQIVPKEKVYALTGIQFMDFNSLFQLFALKLEKSPAWKVTKHVLFLPDALGYLLTGEKTCEYTIASTSQMLNPKTRQLDPELLEAVGADPEWFSEISYPGAILGYLTPEVTSETGVGRIPVITVAGHDTASAVAAIPATDEKFAYLSSGTWSLMGIETRNPIIHENTFHLNFTNEGGVEGTNGFLKNITGLWLLEQCRKEWKKEGRVSDYESLVTLAKESKPFAHFIDPDDPGFTNPASMCQSIGDYCRKTGQKTPQNQGAFVRCIFESLSLRYRETLEILREAAPFPIEKLHIIGGGSQNHLLNQWTANAVEIPVITGPTEATAIGNIMIQAMAGGIVSSLAEMRAIICESIDTKEYTPMDSASWQVAYNQFIHITKINS